MLPISQRRRCTIRREISGSATYLLARIDLMEGNPDKASKGFEETLALSKDPRTLAWSHIYLGRPVRHDGATGAGQGDRGVQRGNGGAGHLKARARKLLRPWIWLNRNASSTMKNSWTKSPY